MNYGIDLINVLISYFNMLYNWGSSPPFDVVRLWGYSDLLVASVIVFFSYKLNYVLVVNDNFMTRKSDIIANAGKKCINGKHVW